MSTFELRGRHYEITLARELILNEKTSLPGTVVSQGDVIRDSHEGFRVISLDRGPEFNGTAKVFGEITECTDMPGRVGWQYSFYDHALGLQVRPIENGN
jgi:hypothetical protein